MEALKKKILEEGEAIGTNIVKVGSFLNHQLDVKLLDEMGEELARRFSDVRVDKVLTVEASGIAIAISAARAFGYVPVVFAKKGDPSTIKEGYYDAECFSFTKRTTSRLRIEKKYLTAGENILIVDDFMATGEASKALVKMCEEAGCNVVGISGAVEKEFQGGSKELRDMGYRVDSLAVITKIEDGVITFK